MMEEFLKDLRDFYVWKEWVNNHNFQENYFKKREEALKNVPRSRMSK